MPGIIFPVDATNKRKSTATAKATLAAALASGGEHDKAQATMNDTKWRDSYCDHFMDQLHMVLQKPLALQSAEAALSYIHNAMEFEMPDGTIVPFPQAMTTCSSQSLLTAYVVHGAGTRCPELAVPYQPRTAIGKKTS